VRTPVRIGNRLRVFEPELPGSLDILPSVQIALQPSANGLPRQVLVPAPKAMTLVTPLIFVQALNCR